MLAAQHSQASHAARIQFVRCVCFVFGGARIEPRTWCILVKELIAKLYPQPASFQVTLVKSVGRCRG